MTHFTKFALAVLLAVSVAASAMAQKPTAPTVTTTATSATATTPATPATTAEPEDTESESAPQVRSLFVRMIAQHPISVARVLAADPSLINDDSFIARYPDIAAFAAAHPEVKRNPNYYTRDIELPAPIPNRDHTLDQIIEPFAIIISLALVAVALGWLVRTIIDQRRWTQLARRQSEVHNKILDRFSSSEEVLNYIKSPAGAKFLESAPISVHTEPVRENAPQSRTVWSIQIGIILATGGLGLLLVSLIINPDSSQGFMALGIIALCIGAGFIASAFVSIYMSRRLAAWQSPAQVADTSGLMR